VDLLATKNAVLNRLVGVSTAVSNEVTQLINDAIKDIEDDHNFQVMKGVVTATTTVNDHTLVPTLPLDWKEPRGRSFYTTQAGQETFLTYLPDEEDLAKEFNSTDPNDTGPPRSLRINMTNDDGARTLLVYPFPNGGSDWTAAPAGEYRVTVPYWRYLPELVVDTDDNWFTIYGHQYVIAQATARGFMLDWDETRAAGWLQFAQRYGARLKRLDASGQISPAGFLHIRTDAYGRRDQGRL